MFNGQRAESDNGWTGYGGPWPYTILDEPDLSYHLERLSGHHKIEDVDVVSFQPYPEVGHNQDRFVAEHWLMNGKTWRFIGVFDGHSGHNTVDHTAQNLPGIIKRRLLDKVERQGVVNPEVISDILKSSISSFDGEITQGLLDLFPGGAEAIQKMSDEEIQAIVVVDGRPHPKLVPAMSGTTALVALVDPGRNLYVASLGDCQSVLGCRQNRETWKISVLSANHNGQNLIEAQRIRDAHPGENECVLNGRVLGVIAVTGAIGDQAFKVDAVFAGRVFGLADPQSHIIARLGVFLPRLLTPPYLSSEPDVQHVFLGDTAPEDTVLIMASDGLVDISKAHNKPLSEIAPRWVEVASKKMDDKPALRILRDGMGGEDRQQVSFWMTVEMDTPWADDTTVLVTHV